MNVLSPRTRRPGLMFGWRKLHLQYNQRTELVRRRFSSEWRSSCEDLHSSCCLLLLLLRASGNRPIRRASRSDPRQTTEMNPFLFQSFILKLWVYSSCHLIRLSPLYVPADRAVSPLTLPDFLLDPITYILKMMMISEVCHMIFSTQV